MGFLNKLWSGLDFWDKKENQQQREQFAQQDEEERRRRENAARAQLGQPVQQQGQQQGPLEVQQNIPPPIVQPRSIMEAFGDKFEANSPQDMAARLAKGEDAIYKGPTFWGQAVNAVKESPETVGRAYGQISGTSQNAREAEARQQQLTLEDMQRNVVELGKATDPGRKDDLRRLITTQGNLQEEGFDQLTKNAKTMMQDTNPAKVAASVADMGLNVAGLGVAGFAAREAGQTLATQGLKVAAREALPAFGQNALINTLQGGVGELKEEIPTWGGAVKKAVEGGVIGTLADTALGIFPGMSGFRGGKALAASENAVAQEAGNLVSATDDVISKQVPTPNEKVEIAPGVKVDAPPEPTIAQAVEAPNEVSPMLLDADARAVAGEVPSGDPLDVPAYQRRNADTNIQEAAAKLEELQSRSDALRKSISSEQSPQVAAFERRQQGIPYSPIKEDATEALTKRSRDIKEKGLNETILEQNQTQADLDNAIKARSAQEALQEGGPVVEKQPQVAKAEAAIAENPPIAPVDDSGKLIEAPAEASEVVPSTKAVEPAQGAEVTAVKAVEKVKRTPQSELPEASASGVAKTGEVGKSKGKYAKGQEYEKASGEASRAQGSKEAANTSYEKFKADVEKKGVVDVKDRDTAVELQRRYKPGTPEHRKLGDIANKVNTEGAQTLGTIEKTIRRTADSKQLTDRFANKLYSKIDDATSLEKADFDKVQAKNEAFTTARDNYNKSLETFNTDPSQKNANAFIKAQKAMEEADRASKFTEYDIAAGIAKGSKNPAAKDFVKKLEQDAGVYTMDLVDTSMLSSTRVMLNNYLNTLGVGAEESLFGKVGARMAKALTGETVGGGSRAGRKLGQKLGWKSTKVDAGLRGDAQGNFLIKGAKNIVTTGNTLGERNIQGATYAGIYDHYKQVLKKAGYKGDELKRRTLVNTLSDPDNIADDYMQATLRSNALASTNTGAKRIKLETWLTDNLAEKMGDSAVAKNLAKAAVRITLGFPTVVVRSAQGGLKRSSLGLYTASKAVANAVKKGDSAVTANLIKDAVKEAGSGATMYGVGGALGAAGLISGSYPTDKDEQEQWKREGKSDNSIKIGSDWYNLPSALGVFALPFMLGANAGENVREGKPITDDAIKSTLRTIVEAAPVDSLTTTLDILDDIKRGRDPNEKVAKMAAGLVRAGIPLGALVNQVAKMYDPTANDTTKGDAIAQFLAKVQDGIPGLSNKLPSREVDGVEIKNPSPLSKLFGAVTTEQSGGVQKSEEIRKTIDDSVSKLNEYGTFSDGVRNILDDEKKAIFDKVRAGEKLDESDMKSLTTAMAKGVSETEDTRFLEDGDYDNNLAVLKLKRDLKAADPTTQKDTLNAYEAQIRRGEVYKTRKTPYKDIEQYRKTSLSEWKALEEDNPKLYQKLWELDEALAKKKASLKSGEPESQKYYQKDKKGRGGRGGRGGSGGSRSSDFTQISALLKGSGTKANKYQAIDKPKSYIPDLNLDNKAQTSLKKSIKVEKGVKYV